MALPLASRLRLPFRYYNSFLALQGDVPSTIGPPVHDLSSFVPKVSLLVENMVEVPPLTYPTPSTRRPIHLSLVRNHPSVFLQLY